jgi:hypothetical protein
MVADLQPGGTGDGACSHAQLSPAEFAPASSTGCLVFVFSVCLYCVFSCFSCTVYLCIAQILLEFLLA